MASGQTPLRQRPYPLESDTPDVAADIEALALALDTAPVVGHGTLAARPAPSVAGNRYMVLGDSVANNNGIEWVDTGSGWVPVGPPDSGWVTRTLPTGWTQLSTAFPVAYRKLGDRVWLCGAAQYGTGGSPFLTLTGLPAPTKTANLTVDNTSNNGFWGAQVTTAGTFTGPQTGTNGIIGLDGSSYRLY